MANVFTDPHCKAVWNFESGALITDSKGGNTLINQGADEDTVDYKQGSCSAAFIRANTDRFVITDASLDSGFPLKSGESNKTFSLAGWIYFETVAVNQEILHKDAVGGKSFDFQLYNDSFYLWISSDGSGWDYVEFDTAPSAGVWYHFGVTYDSSDDSVRIRIWDDTAQALLGTDKTATSTDIHIDDANFSISNNSDNFAVDGNMDEIVVFDDVLSVADIDAIRAGTYGGGPPAQTVLDYERKTRGVARGVGRGAA